MRKRIFRFFFTIVCFLLLSAGLMWYFMTLQIGINANAMVFIPRNTTLKAAIDSIDTHCKLPTPWLVSTFARMASRITGKHIQSGWYIFSADDTQYEVLVSLFNGQRKPTVTLTIPEGLTIKEIAGIVKKFVDSDSSQFAKICEQDSLEGYLMPDTYEFFWREEIPVIINKLKSNWNKQMSPLSPTKNDVILASIVQAEAASQKEMPRIAGVYKNRLAIGMKLEADPTVQYGIGQKRRLLYRDLETINPWNTYVIKGLPPTPINNPGKAALQAAMKPEKHEYLFFVAKGDSSGEHRFAKSGSEHISNVRKYRSRP